jgi:hypothetical protein
LTKPKPEMKIFPREMLARRIPDVFPVDLLKVLIITNRRIGLVKSDNATKKW